MVSFNYAIKDEIGIHARLAGMLAKAAKEFEANITLSCNGKNADATRLMAVMAMGVKCGDEVTVSADGTDETMALDAMKTFFEENL